MAELENSLEKRGDEEDSEEDSNTDEDEVIPDIGAARQPYLGFYLARGDFPCACGHPAAGPGSCHS